MNFTSGELKRVHDAQFRPEGEQGTPRTDEWMLELRERELAKRQQLTQQVGNPQDALRTEEVSANVRLTTDDEERRLAASQANIIGAPPGPARGNSLHQILREEVRRSSRTSLTDSKPSAPPRPPMPPPDCSSSVNKGKEPPEPAQLLASASPVLASPPGVVAAAPAAGAAGSPRAAQLCPPGPGSPKGRGSRVHPEQSPRVLLQDSGAKYLMRGKTGSPRGSPPRGQTGGDNPGSKEDPGSGEGTFVEYGGEYNHEDAYRKKVRRGVLLRLGARGGVAGLAVLSLGAAAIAVVHAVRAGTTPWIFFAVIAIAALQICTATASVHFRKRYDADVDQDTTMLYSLIPADVVAQMHEGVRCIAVRHDSLTFCFSDLVGFTKATSHLHPAKLVAGMNRLFSTFDDLAESMNIMKIKTMGDSYMAVSGFRITEGDHVHSMVLWCFRVLKALRSLELEELNMSGVNVRMGIASGPAVSGIIGQTKPVYDFWGDTVNMASRMESNSVVNRVNCTREVRDRLSCHHGYSFDIIHDVFIKGKGRMDTFLVIDPDGGNEKGKKDADSKSNFSSSDVASGEEGRVSSDKDGRKLREGIRKMEQDRHYAEIEQLASIQSEHGFHNDIQQVLRAVSALTEELELQKATELVVKTVRELLRCDRATLFMVDEDNRQLWSFHNLDTSGRRIRMPLDRGIAGYTAVSGETLHIQDAYEDSRFNKEVDIATGYRTRNLLCYPVRRGDRVIAVIQAINKKHGGFNEEDKIMIALLGRQAGIHLMHGTMYEQLRQSEMRAYILFQVSRDLSTKLDAKEIFESVTNGARKFMQCDRATLFILDHARRELYSLKTSGDSSASSVAAGSEFGLETVRTPIGQGIAGHVAIVGEVTNVPEAYDVPFFDPTMDQKTGYKTKSVLCVPIIDTSSASCFSTGYCLGVLEVVNKYAEHDITQESHHSDHLHAVPFISEDEQYLTSFASFVAITIRNVMLYQQNQRQKECGRLLLRISMVSAMAASYRDLVHLLQKEIPESLACEACQLFVMTSPGVLAVWTPDGKQRDISLGEGPLRENPGIVGRVVTAQLARYNSASRRAQEGATPPGTPAEQGFLGDSLCNPAIDNVVGLQNPRMCIVLPLRYDDHIVGAIQVLNKYMGARDSGDKNPARDSRDRQAARGRGALFASESDATRFDERDEEFLREIARVAAVHLCCQYRIDGFEASRDGLASPRSVVQGGLGYQVSTPGGSQQGQGARNAVKASSAHPGSPAGVASDPSPGSGGGQAADGLPSYNIS